MRVGYDRAYSDIRRIPIPDLPIDVDEFCQGASREESSRRAAFVIGTVLALILTIGAGAALLYGPSSPRVSAIDQFAPVTATPIWLPRE